MTANKTIGLLEEMILLVVMKNNEINGAKVLQTYNEIFRRDISLPAVISVLKRLEKKGLLESRMGERGGRRKKLYKATATGCNIVSDLQKGRDQLWRGMSYT